MDSVLEGELHSFLSSLFQRVKELGIDVSGLQCDHVCYRVESSEAYNAKKAALAEFATLEHEAMIGGRPIATFKLNIPIQHEGHSIPALELPSPKPGRHYASGYEHVEFVIPESFDEFRSMHPSVNFDLKAIAKDINPDISVALGDNMSVKFHHKPLLEVVEMERRLGIE